MLSILFIDFQVVEDLQVADFVTAGNLWQIPFKEMFYLISYCMYFISAALKNVKVPLNTYQFMNFHV